MIFIILGVTLLTKQTYKTAINKYVLPYTNNQYVVGEVTYIGHEILHPGRGWWLRYKFQNRDGKTINGKCGPIVNKGHFGSSISVGLFWVVRCIRTVCRGRSVMR